MMREPEVITGFGQRLALSKPKRLRAAVVSTVGTRPRSSHHTSSQISRPPCGPALLPASSPCPSQTASLGSVGTPGWVPASCQPLLCWDPRTLTGPHLREAFDTIRWLRLPSPLIRMLAHSKYRMPALEPFCLSSNPVSHLLTLVHVGLVASQPQLPHLQNGCNDSPDSTHSFNLRNMGQWCSRRSGRELAPWRQWATVGATCGVQL